MTAALAVSDLSVRLASGDRPALTSAVTFEVAAGETVAIVGESGSGKTVTARAIMGLLPGGLTAHGSVRIGEVATDGDQRATEPLRGTTIALLLQDPFTMLHPLRKIGAQLTDGLDRAFLRSPSERNAWIGERLDEVGLDPSVARRYPHELSGGMRQRVGIAAALRDDPAVLIADEPTTALDATTQREVMKLLDRLKAHRGLAVVLITHDLTLAFATSDRVVVLYAGLVMEQGRSEDLSRRPEHPYTAALLDAEPAVGHRLASLGGIPGNVPAHSDVGDSCAFAPRCPYAQSICTADRPPLVETVPTHLVACVRTAEIDLTRRSRATVPDADGPQTYDDAVLVARDISKTFDGQSLPALDRVDLDLRRGASVAIVGESGSGKTTLARILIGLETSDSGSVHVDGVDVTDWNRLDRKQRHRMRSAVQMVFQDPYSSLDPRRTVEATLREALRAFGKPSSAADIDALLRRVHLATHHRRLRPAALSGGERQRVAIARALAADPQILVFDEAVSALDVSVQAQILELISELGTDDALSVLFITHDLGVARQTTDTTYVLRGGKVVESGPTAEVLDRPRDDYTRRLIDSVPKLGGAWLAPGPVGSSRVIEGDDREHPG